MGDIDSFINMLLAACEDKDINKSLAMFYLNLKIKEKPESGVWLHILNNQGAPKDLIEVIECLYENKVAEKTYESICQNQHL